MTLQIQPKRAVALLAAVTVLLISSSVSVLLWEMRKRDVERARLDTASIAHILREQTERSFDTADQVLRGVQERMQTSYGNQLALDAPGVRLLLGSRALGAPQVDVLAIADAQGRVLNASRDDVQLASSIAGTAYFKAFATGADGLIIDKPVRSSPGEWTLDMARPFVDAAGNFRGVIVATMPVPRLEELHGWHTGDHARPLALYLADGTLLAASPPREKFIGQPAPEFDDTSNTRDSAQVRLVAGTLPLVVGVTNDEQTALASWRERAWSIGLGALLVCAFTVVAAVVLGRELEREARLANALRDANERYHRTVDSLMDAIVAVDSSHNITLFNPAAERMFGIPAQEALGRPVERFIPPGKRIMHGHYVNFFMQSPEDVGGMQHNPDITGLRADGTEFPLETSLARTIVDGQLEVTAVLRDVTERRRSERELREGNRQLRALSSRLQDVREQERTRIAAELHDELGQQLTGLKLELSWYAGRIKEGRGPDIEQVDAMRHQLDATIASVRRIATELRPRVLDDLGFGEALAWQASEFARRTGLKVDVDLAAADCVSDDAVATALFRIVQESLTNAVRHSGAKSVEVQLRLGPADDALLLRVRDDGHGIVPGSHGPGIGLVSMRERALALGGTLRVVTAPGRGTSIEVTLPLTAPAPVEPQEALT